MKSHERRGRTACRVMIGLVLLVTLAGPFSGCRKRAKDDRKEDTTVLTTYIQQSVDSDLGIWEGWGADKLYKDTNIKLDLYPTGTEVDQKLKQYISAGTMPDIIGFRDFNQAKLAMDAGLLLPLDAYKDSLPAIFTNDVYKSAVAYTKDNQSNGTGRLYIMPSAIGDAAYNAYNWVPMLQWKPFVAAGKQQPRTLEDYLDIAAAMVKEKPYTDDGKKVYGFSLFSDWDTYSALEVAALSFFYGIDTEYVSPLMETNVTSKQTASILHDESFYKRACHFYFEANRRGLLDPDSMTQSYTRLTEKYNEGSIMFAWFSWLREGYNLGRENADDPDGYVAVPASDMKIYEAHDQVLGRNWYYAISSQCKNVDKALEFLNWFYSPEKESYLYNGPEGYAWEYDDDGEPELTDEGRKVITDKEKDLMAIDGGGSFNDGTKPFGDMGIIAASRLGNGHSISYRYWPSMLSLENDTKLQREVSDYWGDGLLAEYLHRNKMTAKSTIAVNLMPAVPEDITKKSEGIGEVVRRASWDLIYADSEEEFKRIWSEMCEHADTLGMDAVEAWYQQAWKQAVEKAAKYE